MDALTESGRAVSLANLSGWRKEGLLPPLASHGLGTGKGKSYYWRERNIVAHASATHDLLRRYGRPEAALWMLWLAGFSVPLRQFRRVWAHRGRARLLRSARSAKKSLAKPTSKSVSSTGPLEGISQLLLQIVLAFAGTLEPDDGDGPAIIRVIERALAWFYKANGLPVQRDDYLAGKLWLVVRVMATTLESSDLVSTANDAELRQAQHYLLLAGALLQKCDDRSLEGREESAWPSWLAERIAAPTFLLILVLLRSGRKALLDEIAQTLEKPNRRAIRPPVQPIHSNA